MTRAIGAPPSRAHLRREVQQRIQDDVDTYWTDKISGLIMQGDFLSLLIEENSSVTWKSFIWSVPRGVAKFAINAGLNTLPSADNLRRWGKRTSDLCSVCNLNRKQTLNHILSYCSAALEQGRYTWRHDSVLRTIFDFIRRDVKDGFQIFVDLTSHGAGNGGTIPPDVLPTTQRPDIFLVNRAERKAILFELTVPWDANINSSHDLKEQKYAALVRDLSVDYHVESYCFEVSARGQVSKANRARLKSFLYKSTSMNRNATVKLINSVSKAALLGSFSIFSARNELTWNINVDLSVNI